MLPPKCKCLFIQEKQNKCIKKQVVTNLAMAVLGKTGKIKEPTLALLFEEKVAGWLGSGTVSMKNY